MNYFPDVIFVIRSVGERTEQLCFELIKAQGVDSQNIVIVNEKPFSLALKKSYEIGIKSKKSWLFCIDADVLIKSDSIKKLMDLALHQPKRIFEIQGYIFDKFFGCIRTGGIHLYRTKFLHLALSILSENKVNNRPEATTLKLMQKSGYPYVIVPSVVGLHDFEQDPFDIFRTMFVYSHKHASVLIELVDYWRKQSSKDSDFEVALAGLTEGLQYPFQMQIDADMKEIREAWAKRDFNRKPPLKLTEVRLHTVDQIYEDNKNRENSIDPYPFLNVKYSNILKTGIFKFRYMLKTFGTLQSLYFISGRVFKKIGKKLLKKIG